MSRSNSLRCAVAISAIDLPPMSDRYHQYHEPVILDRGDDPVIADSVAPEPLAAAGQCMAKAARVLSTGDAFAQITQHAALGVGTELAQVADGCAMKLDPPGRRGHQPFMRFLSCRSRLS